jgi:hypothetical protein
MTSNRPIRRSRRWSHYGGGVDSAGLLIEAFGRIRGLVPEVVDGLSSAELAWRPQDQGNSIGWLVWHQSRVHDDHVADVAGLEQVWLRDGWYDQFGLDLPPRDIGYGHRPDSVVKVRVTAERLIGYDAAVAAQTERYVAQLEADDLDRVVDETWTPAVTLGVRLVSVISDCLQHLGQAAYVRGLL